MSEIGDVSLNPQTGQPELLGPRGWQPISQEELEERAQPAAGRFLTGLAGAGGSGVAGTLGKLTGVGLAVGEPAVLLGRAGAQAGARKLSQAFGGGQKMPARVQQRIQQAARPEQGITPFEAARGEGGLQPPRLGGAAGADLVAELPPKAGLPARILDKFLDQRPLKTDQARIVNSGRAEELGFRFLPGQREGQNLLLAGAKSDPIVAGAFDDVFTANREAGASFARKALGLEDGAELGRAELGEAAESIGAKLNKVADDITPVQLDKDIANRVNRLRKVDDDLDDALDDILGTTATPNETVSGQELLSMRSQLGKAERQAWKQGSDQRAERIDGIIKKLDDVIEKNSTNPAARAEYAKAREQWRILIQLEKPGVMSDAGDISFLRLANNFRKEFKGDFARTTFAKDTSRLSPESKDLLDFTKIGSAFKDNVGDSGTATRLGLQSLLNPKQLAQRLALKGVASQLVKQGQ